MSSSQGSEIIWQRGWKEAVYDHKETVFPRYIMEYVNIHICIYLRIFEQSKLVTMDY